MHRRGSRFSSVLAGLAAGIAGATAFIAVSAPTGVVAGTPLVATAAAAVPSTTTVTVPPPVAPSDPGQQGVPSGAGVDPVDAEAASAVRVIEDYWTRTFQGWNAGWVGPTLWQGDGFYDSGTAAPGPSCGEPAPAMNAFYCNAGGGTGFVAWDRQLLDAGYRSFGSTFVYLVLAHEWGHVAQQRLEAAGAASTVAAQVELQADCLAGSTLSDAVQHDVLELDATSAERLVDSLQAMGDNHPWAGEGDHGSSAQRVSWFRAGFDGGVQACLADVRS